MLEFLVWGFWFVLGGYTLWFIFDARTIQPLSLDEIALAWKLHKHESGCGSAIISEILVKDNEVAGFKCGCGHVFLQKRLITQRICRCANSLSPNASKTATLPEIDARLRDQGLRYLKIQEV